MHKYSQLSNLLKTRINHGVYAIRSLPAERQLAEENGVSYMTARKALQELIDDGLLIRGANGRATVNTKSSASPKSQIVLLTPSFHSPNFERWRLLLARAAEHLQIIVRQEFYTHWEEPVIMEALENFNGSFLLASTEAIPAGILKKLSQSEQPLVLLNGDYSHVGIPSIRPFPSVFIQVLLDHLEGQGHTRITCLNVQPSETEIEERIGQWKIWMASHRFTGDLIDEPVGHFGETLPHAYNIVKKLIAENKLTGTAIFCTTVTAGIGAMRAMHEAGIRPGQDIAVCTVDGEGLAAFQIPSLTALEWPDVLPLISISLDWMAQGGGAWKGPLLLKPLEIPLVIRETTQQTFASHPEVFPKLLQLRASASSVTG